MSVSASKPSEYAAAEKLQAEIDAKNLRRPGMKRRTTFDESHIRDFCRILDDLGQLMNRADATRRRRKR